MTTRVCMVVNNLDVGGLEKVVLTLVRHLPAHDVEPSLICLSGPGRLFDELPLPSDRVLVLDKRPDVNLLERLRAPVILQRIRRFLRERRTEIVHAHNLAPLLYGGLAARALGRARPRIVYSEHNQIYRAGARDRRRFVRYVRLADEVVAVSRDLRRTLVDGLAVARPVRVVHNGIEPGAFERGDASRLRRELVGADDAFVVGTAVVLSEQKGIGYLLEAARLVRDADPTVRFVVAGGGPLRGELEATARSMRLDGTVRFLGYRSDVPALLAALDAYVLPSLWEGLPLALLEALASGKPIVATDVGGNPEVVEHGVNGFLVPPRDPSALARAVLAIRNDPGLCARLGAANRARFAREFSASAMVTAHAALYRDLCPSGRAAA